MLNQINLLSMNRRLLKHILSCICHHSGLFSHNVSVKLKMYLTIFHLQNGRKNLRLNNIKLKFYLGWLQVFVFVEAL